MNPKDYFLNLEKVALLKTEDEQNRIHTYYTDMLMYSNQSEMVNVAISIKNTLERGGYLIEVRDDKLDKLLS